MIAALRASLAGRAPRRLTRPQRAAVLVPIVDDGGPLRLLLTRRTEDLPTHGGQVAFPGGSMRPDEDDPVTTALREAEEETALPPGSVEILGLLDDRPTRTGAVAVTPVVGRVERLPRLTPRAGEVARIFTIPLADLALRERWTFTTAERQGRPWRIYYFHHEQEILWGLSAAIVLDLLRLTPAGAPVPPP
jgi:8-oxo-dGTP pyrophosphatase MutT (NUDIX family)